MSKPSPASRRAALQAQREAALRSRRRGRVLGAIAGAAVGVLLAALLYQAFGKDSSTASVGAQVTPPSLTTSKEGMTLRRTPAQKPTLVVYEDYQCPYCKQYGDILMPPAEQLADNGEIGVEVRSITLLDTMLKNDSSYRANVAAACADVAGHYRKYLETVYANQPAKEGDGYTDQQLRADFASQAGIAGNQLSAFQTCYDQRQTHDAVTAVTDAARKADRDSSTPTYWVRTTDGSMHQLDLQQLVADQTSDAAELRQAIAGAK